ncbi:MAG: tRNA pseudouridine(38-40) synthase TruA [Myxococcaceae bacterium]|nr:tRNA pseudouridine(38-40) synthase TruA [Myxococcaceae bacterium]
MHRYKLTLEYDGTRYVGWQTQPNGVSIQAIVSRALQALLGTEVEVRAASRTDAGVHALGQVAAFTTSRELPLKAYRMGLNRFLPHDIAVIGVQEMPLDFDPRRWAKGKRYRYRISNRSVRSPLKRFTHWELFLPLDMAAMREAAPVLLGHHDFAAFRASNCQASTTDRELRKLELTGAAGGDIEIVVEGTAFLRHMVRNIAGSLVEVGKGRQPVAWLSQVLVSRDRALAGPTAPGHGLVLEEVFYA